MSSNWIKSLFPAPNRRPIRSHPRLQLLALEDRTVPATLSVVGTVATIDVDVMNEQVNISATGPGQVRVTSSASGLDDERSGITSYIITDSAAGAKVRFFDSSTHDYAAAFTVVFDNASDQISTVNFEGQSNFGTHDLDVSTYGSIATAGTFSPTTVYGLIQTTSGNITLTANQQAIPTSGTFQGVELYGSVRSVSGDIVIAGRAGDGGGSQVIPANGVFVGADQSIESTGSGSVTVTGTGGASTAAENNGVLISGEGLFQLSARIVSGGGDVTVVGTAGGVCDSGGNAGVVVRGRLAAGGMGALEVTGTGSTLSTGPGNYGVLVENGGLYSLGGNVVVTGAGLGSGLKVVSGHVGSPGNLLIIADTLDLSHVYTSSFIGGSFGGDSTVTLRPYTAGRAITLGTASSVTALGLSSTQLDYVSAGTLIIGAATAGDITVTADIVRAATNMQLINMQLISGGAISSGAGVGSINTGGGSLLFTAGSFQAARTSTDATASGTTFTSGTDLAIAIAGTTPDTGYTQLNVAGAVDLTGVDLVLSGAFVPTVGQSFTFVSATSRTGTFNGLADGATVVLNGVNLEIDYTPTSVLLTAVGAGTGASAGGPYSLNEGQALTLNAPAATGAVAYTWDVNGNGTFGDESGGTVSNGGRTVVFTAAQLATLGIADGPRMIGNLAVKVTDGLGVETTATTTLTVNNVAPTIAISGGNSVNQGATYTLTLGAANDPGVDTVTSYIVRWGDGTSDTFASAGPVTHVYPNGPGVYAIAVDLVDEDGTFTNRGNALSVTAIGTTPPPSAPAPLPTPASATGVGSDVVITDSDGTTRTLTPFAGYRGFVSVAVGDVNGDGIADIIVGSFSASSHIKVFDGKSGAEIASYFAYERFNGGVTVTLKETPGGGLQIVTEAGVGGGAHVKMFGAADFAETKSFLAYDDYSGDFQVTFGLREGRRTIETRAIVAGGVHIRIFAFDSLELLSSEIV